MRSVLIGLTLIWLCAPQEGVSQYFGRNKPRYRDFDFKIFETAHFNIYYYDLDSTIISRYANWFEIWYDRHSQTLDEHFSERNPVLLFNNHAEFQQNFAISGNVDVATGGVTEGLRNRIVLPIALTHEQSFHVIGHELVHAFQYNMILHGDSTSYESLQNYPLWIVEGLAEYMARGRVDVQTSMWMRDAVLNNRFPELKKMDDPDYFPYRFGQAFWSFFTGTFGEEGIKDFFVAIGRTGLEGACEEKLGVTLDSVSKLWKNSYVARYKTETNERSYVMPGKRIVTEENGGRINISPSLSPNGKYICFLSEKNLFTTDLYLAEASSGTLIQKLFSAAKEGHIDQLNSLESAGTWSPDSKRFAFSAFKNGRSVLIIKNIENGKTLQEISFKELPFFSNPSWSPDGKSIVVSGMVKGQTDLFLIDLKNKKTKPLCNTPFSEIHPDWSPDGKKIIYSTDEKSYLLHSGSGYWKFDLGLMELSTGERSILAIWPEANKLNPQFDPSGNILFVCDRDGQNNVYRYKVDSSRLEQLSFSKTGICGLTPFSPSISVSGKRDRMVYSSYLNNSFQIYSAQIDKIAAVDCTDSLVRNDAAVLPVVNPGFTDEINQKIGGTQSSLVAKDSFLIKPYRARFGLSYLGASSGAGYGGNYISGGVGISGGVDLLFNDILGNHQLYTGLAFNGEIYDFAGAASYLNQSWKLPWGASLQHLPSQYYDYIPGYTRQNFVDQDGNNFFAYTDTTYLLRIFEDQLNVFIQYPLSVTQRFELGLGNSYRFFRLEQIVDYYEDINKFYYIGGQKEKLPVGTNVQLGPYTVEKGWAGNVNAAWVGDNSYFGLTSPMLGYRYRAAVETNFGLYDFFALNLDARKYYRFHPFTLALRCMHYARFGPDANRFYPILIGQYGLIHGYDYTQLDELRSRYGLSYEQISGSKIAIGSIECRLPIFGPKRYALIPAPFLPIELNIFLDGGMAWDDYADFSTDIEFLKPVPVFSAGAGLRFNLFGALVLEPYWAWPLRKNAKAEFGFNFIPGW